ncbi:MAG: alpha-galactosidase, partial [Vallitaleaceae bacterium]|nr:alpha-galactosidase [Vallitaleaceae bacterium]
MGIQFIEQDRVFVLQSKTSTYAIQTQEDGYLLHLYWGDQIKKISPKHLFEHRSRASFSPNPVKGKPWLTLDDTELEYPAYGTSDYRSPAFEIQYEDGSSISDFRYQSYEIIQGKPLLKGLPATYVHEESEAQTLEITLTDKVKGLKL